MTNTDTSDIGDTKFDHCLSGNTLLRGICRKFSLRNASYAHVDEHKKVVYGFTTYPQKWVNYYIGHNLAELDPLVKLGAKTIAPTDWSVYAGEPEYLGLFKAAAQFDIGTSGFSIPVIDPFGVRGQLSVTADHRAEDWPGFVERILPELRQKAQVLHLLALNAIDTRLVLPSEPLSENEMKILRMLARGSLPKDISSFFDVSLGTVKLLCDSVLTKLKADNIEQAIGRAVALGVLDWSEFFPHPVLEIVDKSSQLSLGGIVRWKEAVHEAISISDGRQLPNLNGFSPTSIVRLSENFCISATDLVSALGIREDQEILSRQL